MSEYRSSWVKQEGYLRHKTGSDPKDYEWCRRPLIVCLCGSTKFMKTFYDANMVLTLAGEIVLSVGMSSKGDCQPTEDQKVALDELHKRKIDLADSILVLNVATPYCPVCRKYLEPDANVCDVCEEVKRGSSVVTRLGYVGDSTRSEVMYARSHNKIVRWLEPDKIPDDLK